MSPRNWTLGDRFCPYRSGEITKRKGNDHARSRRIHPRGPLLGGYQPTRPGGRPCLLPGAVRVGVRGRGAARDADDAAGTARGAVGTVLAEPFEVPEAGLMAVIVDPEGAALCIWQSKGHKG